MNVVLQYGDLSYLPWSIEKTEKNINEICWLIKSNPELCYNQGVELIIENTFAVYTMLRGALNCVDYTKAAHLILKYNTDGYRFLKDLLEQKEHSDIMKRIQINSKNAKVLCLIKQNIRTNRTLIAEEIAGVKHPNSWIKRIADDLERVHIGEKDWKWFYELHCNDIVETGLVFEDSLVEDVFYEFYASNNNS